MLAWLFWMRQRKHINITAGKNNHSTIQVWRRLGGVDLLIRIPHTPVGPKAIVRTSLLDFTEGTAICIDVPHSFLIQVNCASSLCVLAMMAPHEWARSPNEYMHLHLASTKFPDSTPGEVGATEVEGAARVVEASRPDDSGVHPPRVALPRVLPGSAGREPRRRL